MLNVNPHISRITKLHRDKVHRIRAQSKITTFIMLIWHVVWAYFCITYMLPVGGMLWDLLPWSLTLSGLANVWFSFVIGVAILKLVFNCIVTTIVSLLRLVV